MLDHVMIQVKSWPRVRGYYTAALKPLGYELVADGEGFGGFSEPGKTAGRIYVKEFERPARVHFAIRAPSPAAVQAYFDAALAQGGTERGPVGHRPHYTPDGVGCFVVDPDDNNIEVCYQGAP